MFQGVRISEAVMQTLEQKRKSALATLHHHRDRLMTEHDEGPEGGVLQLRPRIEHRTKVGAFC